MDQRAIIESRARRGRASRIATALVVLVWAALAIPWAGATEPAADDAPAGVPPTDRAGEEEATGARAARDVRVEGHASVRSRDVVEIVSGGSGAPFDETRLPARIDSLVRRLADVGHPFARVTVSWEEDGGGIDLEDLRRHDKNSLYSLSLGAGNPVVKPAVQNETSSSSSSTLRGIS